MTADVTVRVLRVCTAGPGALSYSCALATVLDSRRSGWGVGSSGLRSGSPLYRGLPRPTGSGGRIYKIYLR